MRRIFNPQSGLELHPANEKSRAQLEAMDRIMRDNELVLELVARDLSSGADPKTGRPGMGGRSHAGGCFPLESASSVAFEVCATAVSHGSPGDYYLLYRYRL